MRIILAVVFLAYSCSCFAQQPLSNETVVKMHAAGIGDDLIIAAINKDPGAYSTGALDMVNLKNAGLADSVIAAMMGKTTQTSVVNQAKDSAKPLTAATTASSASGKPRIFLTSASHGTNQNAARDQSMELAKDFERDCVDVKITLNQSMADYTISLNHIEVGLFIRDNQFQIADRNGDLIAKTKEGGSIAGGVKKACALILANWTQAPRAQS